MSIHKRDSISEMTARAWPVDTKATINVEQRLWMQYLGVLTLLGGVAGRVDADDVDTRDRMDRAFVDANILMNAKGSTLRYERCSGGTYGAFELHQLEAIKAHVIKPRKPRRK